MFLHQSVTKAIKLSNMSIIMKRQNPYLEHHAGYCMRMYGTTDKTASREKECSSVTFRTLTPSSLSTHTRYQASSENNSAQTRAHDTCCVTKSCHLSSWHGCRYEWRSLEARKCKCDLPRLHQRSLSWAKSAMSSNDGLAGQSGYCRLTPSRSQVIGVVTTPPRGL